MAVFARGDAPSSAAVAVISAAGAGDAAFGASTGAITGSGSEASTFGEAGEVSAAGDEGVTSVSLFAGAAGG